MNEPKNDLKESFEKGLESIKSDTILSPAYRRKKTIIWAIRTVIAIVIFIYLWKYEWMKWVLIAYIPLNLFSLFSIHGSHTFLNKKINKTRDKIDSLDQLGDENDD